MHAYVHQHADEYALGTLAADDRKQIDAHLASCAACSRTIGDAEQIICALTELSVPLIEPPVGLGDRIARIAAATPAARKRHSFSPAPMWGALAAAVTVSLGSTTASLWHANLALQGIVSRSGAVSATLATSHFRHVNLTARTAGVPAAKVLYAPNATWIYLIINASNVRCRLLAQYADGVRDLGSPGSDGTTSTLFVKNAGKPIAVKLVADSGEALADAELK